jgi:hypothetical protein
MKGKFTIILAAFGFMYSHAQVDIVSILDTNEIKMSVIGNGDLAWNYLDNLVEAPIGSGKSFLYAGSMWMGGLDEDQLHIAAHTYGLAGRDYWPGPIANDYDSAYDATYNRSWIITSDQIENHIANYSDPSYTMPEVIENWPGNGNFDNGESLELAPFEDINNNSFYEPELGEHPLIRGDKAVFVIYNDHRLPHFETGGQRIFAEVHLMMYAYNSQGTDVDNTVFLHYDIINRSTNDYTNFYAGTFLDWDLGNGMDDYIGCDAIRNVAYVYNGNSQDVGPSGYGTNPPAAGVVSLNKDIATHISWTNTTDPINGNPQTAMDYYNYLQGKWRNGNSIIEGGDGMDTVGDPTGYLFPGDVMDSTTWTEMTNANMAGDRRALHAVAYESFNGGETICLDYALVFAWDQTKSNLENVDYLLERIDSVQTFYNNHFESCSDFTADIQNLGIEDLDDHLGVLCLFNSETDSWYLESDEEMNDKLTVKISNVLGQNVQSGLWNTETHRFNIDLENHAKGLYYIQVNSHKEQYNFSIIRK